MRKIPRYCYGNRLHFYIFALFAVYGISTNINRGADKQNKTVGLNIFVFSH